MTTRIAFGAGRSIWTAFVRGKPQRSLLHAEACSLLNLDPMAAEIFRKHRPAMRVLYASGYSIDPPRHVSDSQFFNKPYRPEDILKACKP